MHRAGRKRFSDKLVDSLLSMSNLACGRLDHCRRGCTESFLMCGAHEQDNNLHTAGFRWRTNPGSQPMGRAGSPLDRCRVGLPREDQQHTAGAARVADAHRCRWKRSELPGYAARTTLRMLAALALSLIFTFTYATLAREKPTGSIGAPDNRCWTFFNPCQSIIFSFRHCRLLHVAALAPENSRRRICGDLCHLHEPSLEHGSQFLQSLRTVPASSREVRVLCRLNPLDAFWRVEVPFALPPLVWNMMMSMSGGWFFVVVSEAISVGDTTVAFPGLGPALRLPFSSPRPRWGRWAIAAMLVVILCSTTSSCFAPSSRLGGSFRFEQEAGELPPRSWVLETLRHSRIVAMLAWPLGLGIGRPNGHASQADFGCAPRPCRAAGDDRRAHGAIVMLGGASLLAALGYTASSFWAALHWPRWARRSCSVSWPMLRVLALIAIAEHDLWLPVGVCSRHAPGARARSLQPAVAQFFAAFPANSGSSG